MSWVIFKNEFPQERKTSSKEKLVSTFSTKKKRAEFLIREKKRGKR